MNNLLNQAFLKEILLKYAQERLENLKKFKDSFKKENKQFNFSPSEFGNFPRTEAEILKVLGRQAKDWIPKLASFFEEYKHITSNYLEDPSKEVSILNISSTNRNLNKIYKNKKTVSRLIKKLIEIKGLICVDSSYNFNCLRNKNKCRAYAYNKEIEKLILSMNSKYIKKILKNKSIKIDSIEDSFNNNHSSIENYSFNEEIDIEDDYSCIDKDDFSSNDNHLTNNHSFIKDYSSNNYYSNNYYSNDYYSNIDNDSRYTSLCDKVALNVQKHYKIAVSSKLKIPPQFSNEACTQFLNNYYDALLKPRLEKINIMNKHLPNEQKIRFDWNFHRSAKGFITKIGIRATCKIVSLKEHEDENKGYKGIWRKDYLRAYFAGANWLEYDVRGSIFQITHLLNKGWWLGNESDPYEKMYGAAFDSTAARKVYKSICMPLYFDYTKSIVWHNECRTPQTLQTYKKSDINAALYNAEELMSAFTGEKLDSEVFLHESLIYIDFIYILREKLDLDVVQIYDGFYLREHSITYESLEHIMRQCALHYKEEYDRWKLKSNNGELLVEVESRSRTVVG